MRRPLTTLTILPPNMDGKRTNPLSLPHTSRATRVNYLSLSIIIYLSISPTTHEENLVIGGRHNFTDDE